MLTTKADAIHVHLMGPKGRFTLGQITELGFQPEFNGSRPDMDVIRRRFRTPADLARGDLRGCSAHLAATQGR